MAEKRKKNFSFYISFWLFNILALIILVFLFINIIVNLKTNTFLNEKIAQAEELARPAEIDIIILKDSFCDDCFKVDSLIESIKNENVKIISEKTLEFNSPDGVGLVDKFNITKVPTFIISGEIEKNISLKNLWPKIGEINDNTFIFKQILPPYRSIDSGEIRGRGKFIMLSDSSCQECYDVARHKIILNSFGFTQEGQIIDVESDEGKELIEKYNIKLLPTIILMGDLDIYEPLKAIWSEVGTVEKDGVYVFRQGVKQMGIYQDLNTGEIIVPSEVSNNRDN